MKLSYDLSYIDWTAPDAAARAASTAAVTTADDAAAGDAGDSSQGSRCWVHEEEQ